MAIKKNRKKTWSALFARSKILAFFVTIASYLYSKAECSLAGKLFTSYGFGGTSDGFFSRLLGRIDLGKRFFRPLKRTVSRLVSQSFLLEKINGYLKGWLYTKLSVYGLFCITAGIGTVLLQLLKVYGMGVGRLSFLDMFVSVMLTLVSVPLILSHASLNEAVCESKAASRLFFGWLGCRREDFEENGIERAHTRTALPLGVLFCIFAWWVRPLILITLIGVFVLTLAVFYIPETGIVITLLLIPFLAEEMLTAVLIYTVICFLMKYVRGKRTVKFDPLATAVLAFALFVMPGPADEKGLFFGLIAFFLAINLIKSKQWLNRCVTSVMVSFFLTTLYEVVLFIAVTFDVDYLCYVLDASAESGVTGLYETPEMLAAYVVTLLPVVVAAGKFRNSGVTFLSFAFGVVCLFLTYDYGAWVGMLLGAVLFLVLGGQKTLASIGVIIFALPFVAMNLPRVFTGVETTVSAAEYLRAVLSIGLKENPGVVGFAVTLLLGLIVFLALQKNITLYSKGCSYEGRRISLGALAGAVSFLVMGGNLITADFRSSLVFWLVLGLAACVGETERGNFSYNEMEEFDYSKGDLV